jgi:predicted MPP superfamily phosphohydrolase
LDRHRCRGPSISQPQRIIVPDPKAGYPPVGEPPTEGPLPEGTPVTALGPLLVPGILPGEADEDEQPEPGEEPDSDDAPPTPGGELGAAVAAALQAALERTGVIPPSPFGPAPPPTPPPDQPLDLLDTSSAPWLSDPELGVQWAESWVASQSQADPPAELELEPEAVEAVTSPEPEPTSQAAVEVRSPEPEPEPEPAPTVPTTPPPAPPSAVAPGPVEPLPPPAAPYRPRSLEVFTGHTAPTSEPSTWSGRYTATREVAPEPVPIPVPRSPRPTRAEWHINGVVATAFGLAIGLLAGLVAYAVGPARTDVYLTRYDVPVGKLPAALEGFRIVQVSDLHLPGSAETADSAARLVERARPDIVLLTGDMVDDASPATLAALDRFLTLTRGTKGTFAVLGERESALRPRLEGVYAAKGVRLLTDERASVNLGDARVVVAGFDGSPQQRLQLTPVSMDGLAEAARPRVEIIMTHAPQLVRDIPRADLRSAAFVVTGHTLGGPLGLPSPLGNSSRYRSGWYSLDATHLYVSNGVGTGQVPARLFAPAEVTRFTLRRATQPYEAPYAETLAE